MSMRETDHGLLLPSYDRGLLDRAPDSAFPFRYMKHETDCGWWLVRHAGETYIRYCGLTPKHLGEHRFVAVYSSPMPPRPETRADRRRRLRTVGQH